MKTDSFFTRKAMLADLEQIKKIADQEKASFGFITRGTIKEAIQLGQIMVIADSRGVLGFQHYNHRKRDLQTTFYHKAISKEYRGQGLGRKLVDAVVSEAKALGREKIVLKCPVSLASNEFHLKYGFRKVSEEAGKHRKLNVWQLDL